MFKHYVSNDEKLKTDPNLRAVNQIIDELVESGYA